MVSTTTHSSSSVGYGVIRTASTPSFFHTLVLSHPRYFTPSFFRLDSSRFECFDQLRERSERPMRCRSVSMVTAGALCRVVRLLGGETSATGSATGSASGSASGLGAGSSTANAGSNSGDGEAGG